ncbi:MAG: hypothetical protein ACTH2Q_01575 [Propionibacteriaceae bacterium]
MKKRDLPWFQRFMLLAGINCGIALAISLVVSLVNQSTSFAGNVLISIPTAIILGFFMAFAVDGQLRGLLQKPKNGH